MFFSRRASSSRFLEWKVRAFVVAIVLALAGMYFQEGWMTGAAIAVLALGLLLRFVPAPRPAEDQAGPPGGDDEEH